MTNTTADQTLTRKPGYLVVEGSIGVGKTSLSQRLAASLGGDTLLERSEDNPFLERFYRSQREFALPAQLYFLFQRVRQLQQLRQQDLFAGVRVADYLLDKDALFARINLDDDEHDLYRQVYDRLSPDIAVPDLVIYLQAPVEVSLQRIRKRGLAFEQNVGEAYLKKLAEAYSRFFFHYTAAPLLIVNAAEVNLVDNEQDYADLLTEVGRTHRGRHFYNPSAHQ